LEGQKVAAPYIPPRDSDLVPWATNFRTLIVAAPATYGLVAADGVAITAVVDPYLAAQVLVDNPATRTPVTIADKNNKKQAMLVVLRAYASTIRINAGVTDADKLALGLNLPNNNPSPIPAPTSSPIVTIIGATPSQLTLRYADENTPASRRKPQGVTALQLFVGVSTIALNDPDLTAFDSLVTKQPVAVTFDPTDAGKVATMFGRWSTRTGLVGPFSLPATFIIPAA
jgi:hypothetical protein